VAVLVMRGSRLKLLTLTVARLGSGFNGSKAHGCVIPCQWALSSRPFHGAKDSLHLVEEVRMADTGAPAGASSRGLPQRFLEAAQAHAGRALPPVERWNPPYCGQIDMKIARDGRWFYMGTPIARPALVRLFSTILRKDGDEHVLVTPVERVGIIVEDAPFLAVEMERTGDSLAFRTNLDDVVVAGPDHPIRFEIGEGGGLKPYLRVRGDLWALLTRTLAQDVAGLLGENAEGKTGLAAGGAFFALPEGVFDA
jgi:uncharacterized protein